MGPLRISHFVMDGIGALVLVTIKTRAVFTHSLVAYHLQFDELIGEFKPEFRNAILADNSTPPEIHDSVRLSAN